MCINISVSIYLGGIVKGNVSVVTGGARGLGRNMARALADAGINIAITKTASNGAKPTRELAERFDVQAAAVQCSVSSHADANRMVEAVLARF